MKITESIDNYVRDYPLWSLILDSVGMGLLGIGHIIRYKQSTAAAHTFLASCLICLSIQYACAIPDINTSFFTPIVDLLTTMGNHRLLFIWTCSMKEYISRRMQNFIDFIIGYALLLPLMIASGTTALGCILELTVSFVPVEEDEADTVTKTNLYIWWATLGISITASLSITCSTVILLFTSKEYKNTHRNIYNSSLYLYYLYYY
jgi:hypothetical protein